MCDEICLSVLQGTSITSLDFVFLFLLISPVTLGLNFRDPLIELNIGLALMRFVHTLDSPSFDELQQQNERKATCTLWISKYCFCEF